MLQATWKTLSGSNYSLAIVLSAVVTIMQPARVQSADALPVELLSPVAMDALVSSNAFYPDEVVEHILQAAQHPTQLHEAATKAHHQSSVSSIRFLSQYPDLLRQLDQQLPLTTRLGVAARTQIQDVWRSVDHVRAGFEASQNDPHNQPVATSATSAAPYATAYVPAAYAHYAAGLWAGAAIDELQHEYNAYHNTQTTTGPHGGTATTTTTGGQVTHGNTTYSGVAGVGTVTGPNGNTVNGIGGAAASVTNTGSGYQTSSAAVGAIGNPATGNYAAGAYSGSGYTQQNADGSTTFGRSGTTTTQSSYGSATINRESTGTAAGVGNSSYSGSTDINSTYGNASVDTQAGNSQISTTVTTNNGSQTFTGGDGSVGNSSSQASSQRTASSQRSTVSNNARTSGSFSRQAAQSGRSTVSQFGRGTASATANQLSRPSSRATSVLSTPSSARNNSFTRPQGISSSARSGLSTGGFNRSSAGRSSGSRSSRSSSGRSGGGRSSGGRRGR